MAETAKYFCDHEGNYLGAWDGYTNSDGEFVPPEYPGNAFDIGSPPPSGDSRQKADPSAMQWLASPEVLFKPIEPAPFWRAAFETHGLRLTDVLAAIADPDERYLVENDISRRKTYLRDDPMVIELSVMLGYPPEQMDSLWLYVQENYS